VATIFAATINGPRGGGYGVPNAIVRETLRGRRVRGLSTGPCGRMSQPLPSRQPMGKTLVIAEKPSVGRDLSRILPGPVRQERGLPGVAVARGDVGGRAISSRLAEPDEVRPEIQEVADGRPWPIVPEGEFRLVGARTERSAKSSFSVISKLLKPRRRRCGDQRRATTGP